MTEENGRSNFFSDLKRELGDVYRATSDEWRNMRVSMRNSLRQMRGANVDYIIMSLQGSLPERAAPPLSFIQRQLPLPAPAFSLQQLNRRLRLIGNADNVKGVVFVFRGLSAGFATLQNLRRAMERLQATGKEVIVYTPYLNLAHFYVASVADKIIAPPSAQFDVLGLNTDLIFFKDALSQMGMKADVVQISPYKSAFNQFSESTITPEQQEQMDWLLDSNFELLTTAMANGRSTSQDNIKALIDQAPYTAIKAAELGLIDTTAYEDDLAYLLAIPEQEAEPDSTDESKTTEESESSETNNQDEEKPKAKLISWEKAAPMLTEKPLRRSKKFIGVISLEGSIMMGQSQQPPIDLPIPFIGGATAGEQTINRLIRQAEKMDNMAALIFHVDSPGGSALASDLIGREIERLSQKIPVLVYMGNVAASGGYYVSAPAKHIMSQTGTITGSIGVIMARISTKGVYDRLFVNRINLKRGDRASLYSNDAPMNEEERQIFWDGVMETYGQFKQVVANGRSLPYDELDSLCEGRVWTGTQALDHKLVDSHGDFVDAIQKAAELADLKLDDEHVVPAINLHTKKDDYVLPKSFAPTEALSKILSGKRVEALLNQPLMLMPFTLRKWK
ncbi:MAG: signal peptide peptidase SppA [Chloroflexi bacterium]|nr:signal peptide peptidase SppA [Chloroflexota bacterium]